MVALEGRRRRPAGEDASRGEREAADVAPPRGQFRPCHWSTIVKTRHVSSIPPKIDRGYELLRFCKFGGLIQMVLQLRVKIRLTQ